MDPGAGGALNFSGGAVTPARQWRVNASSTAVVVAARRAGHVCVGQLVLGRRRKGGKASRAEGRDGLASMLGRLRGAVRRRKEGGTGQAVLGG